MRKSGLLSTVAGGALITALAGCATQTAEHGGIAEGQAARSIKDIDTVVVRTALREVRDRVIRFTHEMVHDESGEVAAICDLTAVHVDRRERKSTKLPPDVTARAQAMLAPAAQAS